MKNTLIFALNTLAAFACITSAVAAVGSASATSTTNMPPGVTATPVVRATAQSAAASSGTGQGTMAVTNGVSARNAHRLTSTSLHEIKLTDSGCEATFGRHKLFFQSDIGCERPI